MNIDINVTFKPDQQTATLLNRILTKLVAIEGRQMNTEEAIAALVAKVTEQSTVVASAVTLLQGLADQLNAAKDDPEQLQAVIDQVSANSDALAGAVAANTPTP